MPQETLSELLTDLNGDNLTRRIEAATAMSRLGIDASPASISLVKSLGSDDQSLNNWIVSALENCGAPPEEQLDELLQIARVDSPEQQFWALTLIGRLEQVAGSACNELCQIAERLSENEPALDLLRRAIWAIGKVEPESVESLPTLQRIAERCPSLSGIIERKLGRK